MKCPACNSSTLVIDSRSLTRDEDGIPCARYKASRDCLHLVDSFSGFKARRRKCTECDARWTTVEVDLDELEEAVVYKNEQTDPKVMALIKCMEKSGLYSKEVK